MPEQRWKAVYGPYGPDKKGRYRLVRLGVEGGRFSVTFKTKLGAERAFAKAKERLALEGLTVEDIVELYQQDQERRELAPPTIERSLMTFRGVLWDIFDAPFMAITRSRAQQLYDKRRAKVATTTHLNELNQVKMLFRWAVKRGFTGSSAFEDIEGVGRRQCGKEQLTIDESRLFAAHCLKQLPDPGAVGALIALGLGLRSGEIRGLTVRDLDDNGRVLIVRKETSKSKKARRLVIPTWLAEAVTAESLPLGLAKNGLLSRVRTLCRHAGVTEVTPHGLRGTHATLASAAGAASEFVAASLGHSSSVMTERHYAKPGAVDSGAAERVAKLRLVE